MRKLIVQEWVSLDGYVADRDGGLDFFTAHGAEENTDPDQLQLLETIDTILLGRITYELFVDFWPTATIEVEPIADKLNETKKIVFSNSLTDAPWGKWSNASVIGGDAVSEIKALKSLPGKDMILWGSISLVQQLMQHNNLIDEYHIYLSNQLTGGGRKLFKDTDAPPSLRLMEAKQYRNQVLLRYYATER